MCIYTASFTCINIVVVIFVVVISIITPRAHAQQGVKQSCFLSLLLWAKNIETAEVHGYSL